MAKSITQRRIKDGGREMKAIVGGCWVEGSEPVVSASVSAEAARFAFAKAARQEVLDRGGSVEEAFAAASVAYDSYKG